MLKINGMVLRLVGVALGIGSFIVTPKAAEASAPLTMCDSMVSALYRGVLKRDPTDKELQEKAADCRANPTTFYYELMINLQSQALAAPKPKAKGVCDVASVYREVLGREPDYPAADGWFGACVSGKMTLDQIRQAFMQTQEYIGKQKMETAPGDEIASCQAIVKKAYLEILERPADEGGLKNWTKWCLSGTDEAGIRQMLKNSGEYVSLQTKKNFKPLPLSALQDPMKMPGHTLANVNTDPWPNDAPTTTPTGLSLFSFRPAPVVEAGVDYPSAAEESKPQLETTPIGLLAQVQRPSTYENPAMAKSTKPEYLVPTLPLANPTGSTPLSGPIASVPVETVAPVVTDPPSILDTVVDAILDVFAPKEDTALLERCKTQVTAIYRELLSRDPDSDYWIQRCVEGTSLDDIRYALKRTDEYAEKHPTPMVAPTAGSEFVKHGNNGSVSCSAFCEGASWGPVGQCVKASLPSVPCDLTIGLLTNGEPLECRCARQDGSTFAKTGNNGTVSCEAFCAGSTWGEVGSCVGPNRVQTVSCRHVPGLLTNGQEMTCTCSN